MEAVRAVVGVQAQDRRAAFLAVRARAPGASAEAVEHALSGDRTLVRTWAMRGTLHLLAAADLPLALAVFGPLHLARGERRLTQLGLPPAEARAQHGAGGRDRSREEGPLTRHELAERLRARGVPVDPKGQAPIHVVRRAALAGVLCEVGVRGREELYGPIDPGPLPDRDAAVAELARRYAAAHAPATAADFAAWSGLPAADVRRAWAEPEPPGDADAEGPGPPAAGVRRVAARLGVARVHRSTPGTRSASRPAAASSARSRSPTAACSPPGASTAPSDASKIEPFGRVTKAMRAGIDAEIAQLRVFSPQKVA